MQQIRAYQVWFNRFLLVAVITIGVLAITHLCFAHIKFTGIYWFHLDKERNITTWFSGALFSILGLCAIAVYQIEKQLSQKSYFKYPALWLGFSAFAFYASLDEMTILHENIYWDKIRSLSHFTDQTFLFMTQWQLLFLPVILAAFVYFLVFFAQRFQSSPKLKKFAFAGLSCWAVALALEAVRSIFKLYSYDLYFYKVTLEESLETAGVLLLIAALGSYGFELSLLDDKQLEQIKQSEFFSKVTKKALWLSFLVVCVLSILVSLITNHVAQASNYLPNLVKAAKPGASVFANFFQNMDKKYQISQKNLFQLADYSYQKLNHLNQFNLDSTLIHDKGKRVVFLSVANQSGSASLYVGRGEGIISAVDQAIAQAKRRYAKGAAIKLDVVNRILNQGYRKLRSPIGIQPGLYGFVLGDAVVLPEMVMQYRLVNQWHRIHLPRLKRYLSQHGMRQKLDVKQAYPRFLFRTKSFYRSHEDSMPLYRGHQMYSELTEKNLQRALYHAGDYLKGAVSYLGRFNYSYSPVRDRQFNKYNILRHAGTLYAMLELYEWNQDPKLLEKVKQGISYLTKAMTICPDQADALCIVENHEIKVGGNGLAIVALAKYTSLTNDKQYIPTMQKLALWIKSLQQSNGQYRLHKMYYPNGKVANFHSLYYPGEAMLALLRLYAIDKDQQWLEVAKKSANYIIEERDHGKPVSKLPHDHWFLYALNELYRHHQKDSYYQHAMNVTQAILNGQNLRPKYKDWFGSYYRPPRSTPTATRSEGLYAAYQLIQFAEELEHHPEVLTHFKNGIRFQLQTQYQAPSMMYLPNPSKAHGGFRRSFSQDEVRIDYVQHNISAILGLLKIMQESS